jgi:hypothetical protein
MRLKITNVNPDLAVNPSNRLEEFEALIAELMMRE